MAAVGLASALVTPRAALPAAPAGNPMAVPHDILGIPGPDITGAITNALRRLIGDAIHSFAGSMFAHLSDALLATTSAPLGSSFDAPWRAMLTVAALFAVPILLAGVVTEVLAGRPGQAVRRGVLLPVLIGPVLLAARSVLGLVEALVQGACGLMVQLGIGGPGGFAEGLDRIRQVLGVATGPADPAGIGASLTVVLVAGILAFIIWVELAVRAALLVLLAAFVPLALSGLFWSATARWTRRLLETLAAVLLAPLVITMVMVLATATLTAPVDSASQGVDRAAVALALLFLGTLGLPLTFRLIPVVVEAAVVSGAGAGVARRAQRGAAGVARTAAAAAPLGGAARLAAARGPAGPGPGLATPSATWHGPPAGVAPGRPVSTTAPPPAPGADRSAGRTGPS
jgi:hypothetical protein